MPDLTHRPTVRILHSLQNDTKSFQQSHIDLLRHVRLFKSEPDTVIVSREGKWDKMGLEGGKDVEGEGMEIEVD